MGEEDDTVDGGAADMWGQVAAAARETGRRVGVGDALGRLVGRTCTGKMGRVGRPVRLASWLARAGQAGRASCGPSPFLFLFLFYFSSPLFKFKLIWNLNSKLVYLIHWSFVDMRPTTFSFIYILGILFSYFV